IPECFALFFKNEMHPSETLPLQFFCFFEMLPSTIAPLRENPRKTDRAFERKSQKKTDRAFEGKSQKKTDRAFERKSQKSAIGL
ncbi:MAG: hypothetical protein ACRCT1_18595, partial [Microcoleaceae cyanobacterium]